MKYKLGNYSVRKFTDNFSRKRRLWVSTKRIIFFCFVLSNPSLIFGFFLAENEEIIGSKW